MPGEGGIGRWDVEQSGAKFAHNLFLQVYKFVSKSVLMNPQMLSSNPDRLDTFEVCFLNHLSHIPRGGF